jgi:hypothetical protein
MIVPLIDNIVLRQLPRLIADAEALLSVAAWRDLPAGLRIINCAGGIAGFCSGSGHRFAQAHGCRPGAVAAGVAAESALRHSLKVWHDELPAAIGEAAVLLETVATHELAHALVAPPDAAASDAELIALRMLPSAVANASPTPAERTARGHGARWAAALVILAQRCRQYRPRARHRWDDLIRRDLDAVGIDAQAVADAVGDVADEQPLRALLAAGGTITARVAAAIPDEHDRAAIIAALLETTPAERGHVAPVAVGASTE